MKKNIKYKKFSEEALGIYDSFSKKEGSQHIATPVTIQALLDITKKVSPEYALEMGSGIGTLTYTILKNTQASVDVYEDNDFCKNALSQNLASFAGRYFVVSDYNQKPPHTNYDLFIVDGGSGKNEDGGVMKIVQSLIGAAENVGVVYIEGGRHVQRALLRKTLSKRFIYRLVEYKSVSLNGRDFKGGLAIYCTSRKNPIIRFINYIYWEITEWTSLKNAITYRLRLFFKKLLL